MQNENQQSTLDDKFNTDERIRGNHAWNKPSEGGGVRGLVYSAEKVKELAEKKYRKNYWKIGALVGGGVAAITTSLLLYFLPTYLPKDVSGEATRQSVIQEPPYEGQILDGMTRIEVIYRIDDILNKYCILDHNQRGKKVSPHIRIDRIDETGNIIEQESGKKDYRELYTEKMLDVRGYISDSPAVVVEVKGGKFQISKNMLKMRFDDELVSSLIRNYIWVRGNLKDTQFMRYGRDTFPSEGVRPNVIGDGPFLNDERILEIMFEPEELSENLGVETFYDEMTQRGMNSYELFGDYFEKKEDKTGDRSTTGLIFYLSMRVGNSLRSVRIESQDTLFSRFLSQIEQINNTFIVWKKEGKEYVITANESIPQEERTGMMFELVDLIRTLIYLNFIDSETKEELISYINVVKHVSDETCKNDPTFESELIKLVGEMEECKPTKYGYSGNYSTAHIKIRKFCGNGKSQYEVECYKRRCTGWRDKPEDIVGSYFFEEDCENGELTQRVYINTLNLNIAVANATYRRGEIYVLHAPPLVEDKVISEFYYSFLKKGHYHFSIKDAMRLEKLLKPFISKETKEKSK